MPAMVTLLTYNKCSHTLVCGSRLQHLYNRRVGAAFSAQHAIRVTAACLIYVLVQVCAVLGMQQGFLVHPMYITTDISSVIHATIKVCATTIENVGVGTATSG